MANYLLVYHGGNEPGAEDGAAVMQAWMTWMGSLGDHLVDGGNPISRGWTLSKDGTEENAGANPATGYSVIKADNMQQALELAAGCPHLQANGTIELCETFDPAAGMPQMTDGMQAGAPDSPVQ